MKKALIILQLLICSTAVSQQRIYATIAGGDLYSFNLENCTRHFIGSTGQEFGDIAFTPDGRLWGMAGGDLYQIDTATANATLVGYTGIGSVSLVGLNDSTLLTEYDTKLYGINNNTAAPYYIDTIGYAADGDLTWYDNDLYMVTPLVKIVLNSTASAIDSVRLIDTIGLTCYGAVTVSLRNAAYNYIVGFQGSDVYKICHIDGSYQMLCPSLNIAGTPGAASIRLATQVPPPPTCNLVSSLPEQSFSNVDFDLFPNPSNGIININTSSTRQSTYKIYNGLGQVVQGGEIKAKHTGVSLDESLKGIYIFELSNENGIGRRTFVIH